MEIANQRQWEEDFINGDLSLYRFTKYKSLWEKYRGVYIFWTCKEWLSHLINIFGSGWWDSTVFWFLDFLQWNWPVGPYLFVRRRPLVQHLQVRLGKILEEPALTIGSSTFFRLCESCYFKTKLPEHLFKRQSFSNRNCPHSSELLFDLNLS